MLKSLKVINFRSIEKMDLIFDKNTINFHGENGVGKTNLLHSILFLFGNIIFFGKNDFLIKENSDFLYLEGIFENNGIENKVRINIDNNFKKNILLN
ncbi:MAG: hypothetical protein NWP80_01330 [Candidatus Gracilibacteria bacterium]|nr:hypothetical protein [Candidatus Gracilibacteria bacterium]